MKSKQHTLIVLMSASPKRSEMWWDYIWNTSVWLKGRWEKWRQSKQNDAPSCSHFGFTSRKLMIWFYIQGLIWIYIFKTISDSKCLWEEKKHKWVEKERTFLLKRISFTFVSSDFAALWNQSVSQSGANL